MRITKLSENFTPLRNGIFFSIDTENDTPADLSVEVVNCLTNEVVATQTLHGVISTTVNIAPYIELPDTYTPKHLAQTTLMDAPTATYKIRCCDIESERVIVSVNRNKLTDRTALITSLPSSRRIAYGDNDEMLIISKPHESLSVEIVTDTDESLRLAHSSITGASIFTLSLEDFEHDIRALDIFIYDESEELAHLHYVVTPRRRTAVRLAWLSDGGSIEHYTFPVSHREFREVEKLQILQATEPQTISCKVMQFITVCSRYEPHATISALAQIASSPKVWLCEVDGSLQRVAVTTQRIEYNLLGTPDAVVFELCLWQEEVAL